MAYDGIMMHQVKNLLIETIKGGRINKIYQISKYELLFQVRANKKNYQLLISSHPMYARVQLTSLSYPTPESPNPLTMLYRKLLEGGYIKDIEQIDLDRIFKITFRCHNELGDYYLYSRQFTKAEEMYTKGIKLNPSEIHFQLNLAHVYLFTDRISEAKAIHKKYAHESLSNSKTWIAQTKSDFITFEKHKLPTDNFKKILRVLE